MAAMKNYAIALAAVAAACACCAAPAETAETNQANTNDAMNASTTVIIETSLGNIEVELDAEKAPATVANFLSYVDESFYDGTIFHRVIPNFMVQGGGFTADMVQKKTKAPIKNEAANGLKNTRGTIAMARTMVVDSATAQFFINTVDNAFLDFRAPTPQGFGYAVFGRVTSGMEVVDAISAAKTGIRNGMRDVPLDTVAIKTIRRK
jgi:cyclophilin family peptidyl-prolyl cis-trans isomerase